MSFQLMINTETGVNQISTNKSHQICSNYTGHKIIFILYNFINYSYFILELTIMILNYF